MKRLKYIAAALFITMVLTIRCGISQKAPVLLGASPLPSPSIQALCPNTFEQGDGSSLHPYHLSSACDFQRLKMSDLHLHYKLVSELDLSELNWPFGLEFSGVFDGNNQKISRWTSRSPLFENNFGTIQNLFLSQAKVTRSSGPSGGRGGILVGTNHVSGRIINCTVSGTIENGYYFIGGIAGANSGEIVGSRSLATIRGVAGVGGLIGYNSGTISKSSALGDVYATNSGAPQSDYGVGALVGYNQGTVINSYASGQTTGTDRVGGLIGNNIGHVSFAYAIGSVVGISRLGGLIGNMSSGTVISSFWNIETSGQLTSAGGTGALTSPMQNPSLYVGWDFTNVWHILGGYPAHTD